MRKWIFLLLVIASFAECKLPSLTPRDVKGKIEEVLKAHVSYKAFTPDLMKRVLVNFLDELDPTKTYFLEAEIAPWTQPSDETLQRALTGFKTCDFSVFHEIHAVLLSALERRNSLELELSQKELPSGVKGEEFKDLSWATERSDLGTRLLRIKALQAEAAGKMGEESRGRFLQLLEKRRLNRESELTGQPGEERSKVILSTLLKAATASLDSHTNYFTPSEANQFMIQVQQRLFGIGAQLRDDLDGLTVMRILENSPASQSNKLKINDKIIAVDHEPVVGMDITEAVELIRGEKGRRSSSPSCGKPRKTEKRQVGKVGNRAGPRTKSSLKNPVSKLSLEPYGDGVIATLRLFSFYQDPKVLFGVRYPQSPRAGQKRA